MDPWDNPRRLAMGKIIAEQIKDIHPGILSGDFNIEAHTETIAQIEKYYANIFKDTVKVSFNMRYIKPYIKTLGLIDMVLISPGIKILESSCPDVDVSDHLPQIVRFEI